MGDVVFYCVILIGVFVMGLVLETQKNSEIKLLKIELCERTWNSVYDAKADACLQKDAILRKF